jgi:serpin B
MNAMRTTFVLVLLLALLAAGCGEAEESAPTTTPTMTPDTGRQPVQQGQVVRSDVERATSTDVTDSEVAAVVAGNTEFAYELFRTAAADGNNVFLSPYSVAAALTMTYAGARGTTAEEMANALMFGVDGDRIHTVRNELDLRVTTIPPAPPDDNREPMSIEITNSLWGQYDYPFLEEFLTTLAENYDAGMNLVDFATDAEAARVEINEWVEEQTRGRIIDLIPQGVIDSMTRLVLVNAIWFKASWAEQFNPEATADSTFHTLAGGESTVPFMNGGGMMPYAAGDGFELLRIPYAGDAAMVVVLPEEGRFDEIAAQLDSRFLDAASNSATTRDIDLAFPKFEFTSEFGLSKALQDMGMVEAFAAPSPDGGADFTGMTEQRELFIQDVVHQAFVSVDETGTEAAAATAVIVGLTSVADPPLLVKVDRPFIFMIEHSSTGELLFIGQVADPAL